MDSRLILVAMALLLLAGCTSVEKPATPALDPDVVTVRVDARTLMADPAVLPRLARVELSDIRQTVHNERTVLGISMGRIELVPDEMALIQILVQAKADQLLAELGSNTAPTIYCGVRQFQLSTPSTIAYWDVNADIELVLRAGDRDWKVRASATRRTYWHPSRALLRDATEEALTKLAIQVEKALRELLPGT